MNLRSKVLLILIGIWIIISILTFAYSRNTLTNDYAKLEQRDVANDIERTSKTLTTMLSSLKLINSDWSQWDDAYHFMHDKDKAFTESNLMATTFANANINLILFFDNNGILFYGLDYDLTHKQFVPVPTDLIKSLEASKEFTHHTSLTATKTGMVKTPEGYVMLSSMPLLSSKGKGPIRGAIVMGYFISDKLIEELSEIVKMQVHLYTIPLSANNKLLLTVYERLKNGANSYIAPLNDNLIAGYTFIYNVDHQPIGILEILESRRFYNEGVSTIKKYLIINKLTGIIYMILIWYLLKVFVLNRVIKVSNQVIDIKTQNKFSRRIESEGKDELGMMVSAMNSLMEIIELTENQLKYRINLRSKELKRLSNLNKNLHAEVIHQKEIEIGLREGEKALQQIAYYDVTTGLPNRYYFHETLLKILTKAERDKSRVIIFYIDADKFKAINDNYGHDIGDEFLKHTASQLKASLNGNEIVARLGGDEFIACMRNIADRATINKIAQRLLVKMSEPLNINGLSISSTFSIGISISPDDGASISELEKHADLAMYFAKKKNGNAYCYYDELMREEMV